jgi:hypothetical protein
MTCYSKSRLPKRLIFQSMAPNLALSQHDLIRDIPLDQKLKTREMADTAETSGNDA